MGSNARVYGPGSGLNLFPPILVKLFIAGATRTPHNMPCSRLEISSIRKRVVKSTTLLSFVQLRWLAVRVFPLYTPPFTKVGLLRSDAQISAWASV